MIDGYLDESGIQDGAAVCLIGGYFGGPGQWKKVGSDWSRILDRHQVKEFHAKEFWAVTPNGERVGPYQGWSDEKAQLFLEELVEVIVRCKIHAVSTVLVISAFDRLSYNQRRFLTGGALRNGKFVTSGCPSKPYFVPFQSTVLDIADEAPRGGRSRFFFDLNKQFKGYALDLYALLKRTPGLRAASALGEISFPTGLEAPQLQTADLLCYRTYQFAHRKLANDAEEPDPLLGRLISQARTHRHFLWLNDQAVNMMLDGVSLPPDE